MNATNLFEQRQKKNSKIYLILLGGVVISFLLPWVNINLIFINYAINGFELAMLQSNLSNINDFGGSYQGDLGILMALILIPILMILGAVLEYLNKKTSKIWIGISSLSVFIGVALFAIIQIGDARVLQVLSIGFYLCLLCQIGLLIVAIQDRNLKPSSTVQPINELEDSL